MKSYLPFFWIIPLFLCFLLFPSYTLAGASNGLLLWYKNVVPVLFPFILCTTMLFRSGFFLLLRRFPSFFSVFITMIGFVCGYPMGAKLMNDFALAHYITKTRGNYAILFCNNASPMFLTAYVYLFILEKCIPFSLFLFLIFFPIFFVWICTYPFLRKKLSSQKHALPKISVPEKISFDSTIMDSFTIIVKIGVYMMLFSIISQYFLHIKYLRGPAFVLPCFLEISTGLFALKNCSFLHLHTKIALICSLTTFGGLCCVVQTKSVIEPSGLSILTYLCGKLLFCVFTFIITIFILRQFPFLCAV